MKRYRNHLAQLLLPLLILAAVACGLVFWLAGEEPEKRGEMLSSMGFLGELTGFSVTTGEGGDFPSQSGLGEEALRSELDRMVQFADGARFNTIFFEARAQGMAFSGSRYFDPHPSLSGAKGALGSFDPLKHLCDTAGQRQVQVCALVDLSAAPAQLNSAAAKTGAAAANGSFDLREAGTLELLAVSTAELGREYSLGGILLTGLDGLNQEEARRVLEAIRQELQKEAPGMVVGLLFDGNRPQTGISPDLVRGLLEEKLIDLAVPRLTAPAAPAAGEQGYAQLLNLWAGAAEGCGKLMTANPLPAAPGGEEPEELCWQLLLSATGPGVSGTLLEHYGPLSADPVRTETLAGYLASPAIPLPELDFPLPSTLAVTYPAGDVSVTDTAVFLMGTSDPGQPLTLDGEEVVRTTAGGTWGALAKLEMGENTFTFRQGEETARVTVRRYTPGPAVAISDITEGSVFPRFACGVDSDAQLTLSCMAPAGGTVTAQLYGKSVTLSQSAQAEKGAPVAYRGTLTLNPGDYDPDSTTRLGAVTYRLSYNGAESSHQSQGEVYVAGRNVPLVVENIGQLSSVLSDPDNDDSMLGTLKPGAVVQVEKAVRTSRSGVITMAYKLRGSGYILAGTPSLGPMVRVQEGKPELPGRLDCLSNALQEDGSVVITLGPGTPAVLTSRSGDTLTLDCLGIGETGELSQLANSFVQGAAAEAIAGGIRITLSLNPAGQLWGYDLYYRDGNTCLYLKPAPQAGGSFARPLSGVTVLLDPGHGGSDPGAMGVAGRAGPAESQVNLAVTQAVQYRLEQLGAQVRLTRGDDSQLSLFDRVDASTAIYPDIFLSIHHNSGVLTGDMNRARRMECYYFEDGSRPFAQALMDRLPGLIGRPGTEPEQARYYVTRQTANPAVLLEVGFMVNPLEYEECIDRLTILKTACGVAEAVVDIVG